MTNTRSERQHFEFPDEAPNEARKKYAEDRRTLYNHLAVFGVRCANELAESFEWPIDVVSERLAELRAAGHIIQTTPGCYQITPLDTRQAMASAPPSPRITIAALASCRIRREEVYLLCQKGPGTAHAGQYVLPGGGVKQNETLTEALMREVNEETGLSREMLHIVNFQHVYDLILYGFPGGESETRRTIVLLYRCTVDPEEDEEGNESVPDVSMHHSEHQEIHHVFWATGEHIRRYIQHGRCSPLLATIALQYDLFESRSGTERYTQVEEWQQLMHHE